MILTLKLFINHVVKCAHEPRIEALVYVEDCAIMGAWFSSEIAAKRRNPPIAEQMFAGQMFHPASAMS
jgi:hypothetical protein